MGSHIYKPSTLKYMGRKVWVEQTNGPQSKQLSESTVVYCPLAAVAGAITDNSGCREKLGRCQAEVSRIL